MLTTWTAVSMPDRTFDDVMGSVLGTANNNRRTFDLAVDVRRNDDELVLVCDVPGVKRDDLVVTLENHVVTVEGTRKFDGNNNEQVMLGRWYGPSRHSFTLPDSLDEDNLTAHLGDGALTVRIPRPAKAKPRKIQLAAGSDAKKFQE